ncbi:hypothetical protein TNCV_2321671 [Trichonephila clavipes]|nr:hypothetical protein TNCV_2321671 [Trichonephila clavipes]
MIHRRTSHLSIDCLSSFQISDTIKNKRFFAHKSKTAGRLTYKSLILSLRKTVCLDIIVPVVTINSIERCLARTIRSRHTIMDKNWPCQAIATIGSLIITCL